MPYAKGRHPGTTWHKTDFQCHTPRDRSWIGAVNLPGGTPDAEAARHAWAAEFIAACVARRIAAVAITDHHDIALVPYIQKAGLAADPAIIVFPGFEVTCSDDAQCLAIFDPASETQVLQKLLLKLPGVMTADDADAKTAVITPTSWTVLQVFEAAQNDEHLRGACIVFPHFSDGVSHKHLNVDRFNVRFSELVCDGLYIEKPYAELEPLTLDKAYGKVPEWGTRRKAIVVTGDNRNGTWERLGKNGCWIKLGERTIEAVRQALLADEARIAYDPPEIPLERIVEIIIQSTLTGPNPISITFNAGFNALIGGRGSGKSALLEYLRFGLARTERDLGHETRRDREEQLIEETLVGGFVQVTIEREGVLETWRRDAGRDQIAVTPDFGDPITLTLPDARRRFRGRAFFQKQLSTTTRDPASAIDQITGIAAAEALDKRREIDQAIDNAKRSVTTALQQVVAHWQTMFERASAFNRAEDLKARIQGISNRLKNEGVSHEHLTIISDAPRYLRGRSYINYVLARMADEHEKLVEAQKYVLTISMEQFTEVETFEELAGLKDAVDQVRIGVSTKLREAITVLQALGTITADADQLFTAREKEFQGKHAEAVAQQTKHKSLLEENGKLNAELKAAEELIARLSAPLDASEKSEKDFADARANLKHSSMIAEGSLAKQRIRLQANQARFLRRG